ncbi:N-glycosylase/DNA lyase [Lachnospiraceae bacterium]|nr:N-glycosylase/DNA lyase [Lachnospiraceae bacterium]
MILEVHDDFDLKKIAESGQCFRWNEQPDGSYRVIAGGYVLNIRELFDADEIKEYSGKDNDIVRYGTADFKHTFFINCGKTEFYDFWEEYLDLKTDYSKIRAKIDKAEDDYLFRASETGKGIRILKQEYFETLMTFIISQRKNIPAIRASVEKLCKAAGIEKDGCYLFPTPEQMASLSEDEISACGTGYRTKYLMKAAKDIADGEVSLEAFAGLSDAELLTELEKLYGVGVKVASCTALFAYHRMDFFPEDVWIKRVLADHYDGHFPLEKYTPWNGVMQQYLFFGQISDK